MRHYVGLDVGKSSHWACVLDEQDEVILSRKVEATEEALEAFCSQIAQLGVNDQCVLGIDLAAGPVEGGAEQANLHEDIEVACLKGGVLPVVRE